MPGFHWLPDGLKERLLDWEGDRDAARLESRMSGLRRALAAADEDRELEEEYRAYLNMPEVDRVMALFLPTARFLSAWCTARRPERIADLGSGFSSWVVRRWAAEDRAVRWVSADGALLVDDIHKHRMWKSARRVKRRRDVEGFSLRAHTLDEYGRYAWLALRSDSGR